MNPRSLIFLTVTACFFSACTNTAPTLKKQTVKTKETNTSKRYAAVPPPPKKKIVLKEVQDDNYSPEYMYPDDKYKKDKPVQKKEAEPEAVLEKETASMSKEECISMIGQQKFDKYAEMYGSESAPIKRCTLLKSMQKS
ncbi:hypothetical protein MNB_SV-10-384 [hydrothermal vent metagenome]|uniref:Lipoprotein n=1 Tax=hydrothermal vent metagenome TaxID=652676 RepID=A0A1W1CGG8_9ZZZZ